MFETGDETASQIASRESLTMAKLKRKIGSFREYNSKNKTETVKKVDPKPKEGKVNKAKMIAEYEFKQKFITDLTDPDYIEYLGEPTLVLGQEPNWDNMDWLVNIQTDFDSLADIPDTGPYPIGNVDEELAIYEEHKDYETFSDWFAVNEEWDWEDVEEIDPGHTWTVGGSLAPCGGFRTFAPKMVISWGKKTYIPHKNNKLVESSGAPSNFRFRNLPEYAALDMSVNHTEEAFIETGNADYDE